MKTKNLLTIIPVACAAINSQAGTMGEESAKTLFNGVYIGAEGGITNVIDNFSATNYEYHVVPGEDGSSYTTIYDSHKNHNFGTGSFSLGIGHIFYDNFYLGAEALLNIGNKVDSKTSALSGIFSYGVTSNTGTGSYFQQAKLNYAEFDLDFKVGALLQNTSLIYGRIGAAFNRTKLQQYYGFNEVDAFGFRSVYATKSENVVGVRAGVGFEQQVMDYLSLRLDYSYTWYQKQQMANLNNSDPVYPQVTLNGNMNIQSIMVGANLYLDDVFSNW